MKTARPRARTTIAVQGARVHNLKNISVEIPRDQPRRRHRALGLGQVEPGVRHDLRRGAAALHGVAVELRQAVRRAGGQAGRRLRLRPVAGDLHRAEDDRQQPALDRRHDDRHRQLPEPALRHHRRAALPAHAASRRRAASSSQILEAILSLPEGAEIELRAPVFKVYGEELDFVFTEVRKKGCRRLIVDGKPVDMADEVDARRVGRAAHMDAVVDRFVVGRTAREGDQGGRSPPRCWSATACCRSTSSRARARPRPSGSTRPRAARRTTSSTATSVPEYFVFNNPESACRTCGGLGVDKLTHPELLIPDPARSIRGGCFVREAFRYNPDTWDGRMMYSLSQALGFSLDTPWEELPETARHAILYGIEPRKIAVTSPPDAKVGATEREGREVGFGGIARRIERYYRRYRQRGEANSRMEAWLDKVMVEHTCPDCNGARARATRGCCSRSTASRSTTSGSCNFDELHAFLGTVEPIGRGADAGRQVSSEIRGRLDAAARHRARLPQLQSPLGHAVGRRVAAHPPVDADRLGADGHALRARRAEHRAAPQGQRQDDRHARAAARHRQHGDRRRARRRHHSRRRSRRRDGTRARRARRRVSSCRAR